MAQRITGRSERARGPSVAQAAETIFEQLLWRSRLVMLVGVVASITMAVGVFYVATLDAAYVFRSILSYGEVGLDPATRASARVEVVTGVVKAADSYLIAAILLLFGLGLYELFVNRINAAEQAEVAPLLLRVRSVDDLKDRIAKLILLVLVIEFFQYTLRLTFSSAQELLLLALAILLVGLAVYVSSLKTRERQSLPVGPNLPAAEPSVAGTSHLKER